MSWEQVIRERRSIRKFNNQSVPQEVIYSLLRSAELHTAYEGESHWRYVYAGTSEANGRLADIILEKMTDSTMTKLALSPFKKAFRKRFMEAAANLIVIADKDADPARDDANFGTICRILQSFQLLGWKEKIGMIWITEPYIQHAGLFAHIGLQQNERFVGLLQIGGFDKSPKGRMRTPAERLWTTYNDL